MVRLLELHEHPLTYMIGVGFMRKLGSCGGSKDTHTTERIKTASPLRKPLEDEASERLMADRINNILVLFYIAFNKI